MVYYEDIVIDQNLKTKCELCKVFLDDSDSSIENHINDDNHTTLYMQRLLIQNNISIKNYQMTCGICEQEADIENVIDHTTSPRHKTAVDFIRERIKKDGGFLVLPETISKLGSNVNCLVCNRSVEYNLEAITTHIASGLHRQACSIAVQPFNGIFSVEDSKDDLWCKICQVYFENYVELILEHVHEDPKHIRELGKILMLTKDQNICIDKFLYDPREDKAVCKKCNIEVPCNVDNLDRHINGKRHTS